MQDKDPTREAVVRSLQEATQEMERHIRALETEEKSTKVSSDSSNNDDKSPPTHLHTSPPTPPPSPPGGDSGDKAGDTSPGKPPPLPSSNGCLVTALPAVTIAPYGSSNQPNIKKLQPSLWEKSSIASNNRILTNKPAISVPKSSSSSPLITQINNGSNTGGARVTHHRSSSPSPLTPPSSLSSLSNSSQESSTEKIDDAGIEELKIREEDIGAAEVGIFPILFSIKAIFL